MIRITFSPIARDDLRIIGDYIAEDNLAAALLLLERIETRCNELRTFPLVGRKRDDLRVGLRSLTEGEYVIFYRLLNKDEVLIVRVLHGKRDVKAALDSEEE